MTSKHMKVTQPGNGRKKNNNQDSLNNQSD